MSDIIERRTKRATIAAIVSLYGLAITWAISSFFVWTFLATAVYFLFLRFYYSGKFSGLNSQARFNKPVQSVSLNDLFNRRTLLFISVAIFFLIILIPRLFSSNKNDTIEMSNENGETVKADGFLEKGNEFYRSQNYDSALWYFNKINTEDELYKEALYNKTLVYYDQKNYSKAISTIRQCIRRFEDYGSAKQLLGDCYSVQEKQDSALLFYNKAYLQGERNPELCHWLGYLYDVKTDYNKAITFYKEALSYDSARFAIYERLATLEPKDSSYYLTLSKKWKKQ